MSEMINETLRTMPLLALRGLSVFPGMLLTFDVERSASVAALNMAVRTDQLIFLAAQKDPLADAPDEKDIYRVGTVCRVRQQLHQPRGSITRVLVEGLYRAEAVSMNLDGKGKTCISTGIGFFDHMLEQIGKHGGIDLTVKTTGDLYVDEHHTIEDTGIAIGECIRKALGDKRGIERYGYTLPMDDCLCQVALDFGGRPWIVWDAEFKREKIGEMPTEMFFHFFKSLSDAALMNLNIKAEGTNEHHKIEGIFKAFARSVKMAVKRDIYRYELPSTKGKL